MSSIPYMARQRRNLTSRDTMEVVKLIGIYLPADATTQSNMDEWIVYSITFRVRMC